MRDIRDIFVTLRKRGGREVENKWRIDSMPRLLDFRARHHVMIVTSTLNEGCIIINMAIIIINITHLNMLIMIINRAHMAKIAASLHESDVWWHVMARSKEK